MKKLTGLLLLVFFGLALSPLTTAAQEQSYSCTFQVVKSAGNPSSKLLSVEEWKKFLRQPGNVIMENLSEVSSADMQSYTMGGKKNPLGYNDAKSGGNQVQYVDLGAKIDAKIKPLGNGTLLVDARGERSGANPHPQAKERANSIIFESQTVMKRGQVAVFACARGSLIAKCLKDQLPAGSFKDSDWIIMAVTIE